MRTAVPVAASVVVPPAPSAQRRIIRGVWALVAVVAIAVVRLDRLRHQPAGCR